jgi:hypothetical protein
LNIIKATTDPKVFGPFFKDAQTWSGWRTFLKVLFGIPLDGGERQLFRECTGRQDPAKGGHSEAWLVIGRRGGKSFILALVAVFLASFHDWRPFLGPGEVATIMVIAQDRRQARHIMRYIKGLLSGVPMLARIVRSETRETITLVNQVVIEIHSASFRSTRGYTIVAALLDELAFWPTDNAAEPDYEVVNAISPGMATIPGAMLLCASSPYARKGALWDAHRKHFGKDGDPILVWQADTRRMNPTVPQRWIDEKMERDPASAAAEYGAQFRSDIESFISREAIEACVSIGVRERPPVSGTWYKAFVDPSGGSGTDSMTLAIGHREGSVAVIDLVREVKPPFSPEAVVEEFCPLLKAYRVSSVQGDKFAGEWPREQFKKRGVRYEAAARPKSDLYRDLLPAINSRRIELLDHPRLVQQIVGLERRTAWGGRDSIDHADGQHDDIANACAGLTAMLASSNGYNLDALAS